MGNPDTGLQVPEDLGTLYSIYDEMNYAASGVVPYESEGTFAVVAGRYGLIQYTSGATAGNRGRLNQSVTQLPIDPTKDILFNVIAQTIQTVQCRHFYGMFGALPTAANPPVEQNDAIYFRRKDAAGVVNWEAVCRKGGVETAVDTGLVGDANQHNFKIIVKNAIVQFYIDGVLKATISTNVPVNPLLAGLVWVTTEAVAKNDVIGTLQIINSRV